MESTELRFSFLRKLQELMLDEVLMEDLDRIYVPLANMIAEGLNIEDKMQLIGVDVDKNAIQRIECGKRFVTDIELKAFAEIFGVSLDELI